MINKMIDEKRLRKEGEHEKLLGRTPCETTKLAAPFSRLQIVVSKDANV